MGKSYRRAITDRESGPLRRLQAILARHPELWFYHQGDPRGCAVYIGRKADVTNLKELDSLYTRGIAACID